MPVTGLMFSRKGSKETKYNNFKDESFGLRMETGKGSYKKKKKREANEKLNNIRFVLQAKIKQKSTFL